jgi:hypothetical protein
MHNTFHVLLLEPYNRRPGNEFPDPVKVDEKQQYLVDRIFETRGTHNNRQYRVRWVRYSEENDIWESERNLKHLKLFQEFKDAETNVSHAKRTIITRKTRPKKGLVRK